MKAKPIFADPFLLATLGVRTLRTMCALIYLGRCGLNGSVIPDAAEALGWPANSVDYCYNELVRLKLAVRYARQNARGRAYWYCVSVKGWEALTTPPIYTLFPTALTHGPLVKP